MFELWLVGSLELLRAYHPACLAIADEVSAGGKQGVEGGS